MANKKLFGSFRGKAVAKTDGWNEELAPAYRFEPKHRLAQYAATGCLSSTFYATASEQLDVVLDLASKIEDSFVAKCAVFTRRRGFMKDMPAVLCASLSTRDVALLEQIFPLVIDNGKMLRNFVQVMRSGAVGRKSLGTAPKRMVRGWLESRSAGMIFRESVGQSPSMADIVKMVHPKPATAEHAALYGWMIGRACDAQALPEVVRKFESYKSGMMAEVPDVPFQMLTALDLSEKAWKSIARNASWTQTRMNLATFARHGVFEDRELVRIIAGRLRKEEWIRKSRAFPYQLMAAWMAAGEKVPQLIREALQDAMEIAIANVPAVEGRVFICPDVSGSMASPVTGHRKGSSSKMRCIDVAALTSAAFLRKNRDAMVLPFEQKLVEVAINGRDSVMTNAEKLASIGGGGTNCSAPLAWLNRKGMKGDLVVYISDNESWVDARGGRGTELMRQWETFRSRNPKARLVCIDVQPYGTTQAVEREDVLNIGGFSDAVFSVVGEFAKGAISRRRWVDEIEATPLEP